jgi:acetyltransferase-like isoleucine patch superfamily enzyme
MRIRRTHIGRGCTLRADHGAVIDVRGSSIGPNSVIVARQELSIAEGCALAEMVVIRDQDHCVDANTRLSDSDFLSAPIQIGANVWIGAKASVLRGSRIGDHAIIAAHSVVRGNVESRSVYAGVPAIRVR